MDNLEVDPDVAFSTSQSVSNDVLDGMRIIAGTQPERGAGVRRQRA